VAVFPLVKLATNSCGLMEPHSNFVVGASSRKHSSGVLNAKSHER
jgi:hypothetical protein